MFALLNTTQVVNVYPGEYIDSTDGLVQEPSKITDMKFGHGTVKVFFENGREREFKIGACVKVYFPL